MEFDVEYLKAMIQRLKARINIETKRAKRSGSTWSDSQWEAFHETKDQLEDQLAYNEEQLANLG